MKNKIRTIIFSVLVIAISSCTYLDVSDELAGGLTNIGEVFDKPSYARRFYGNVFTGIPDYSNMVRADWDDGGQTGLHNPWTGMTDEISTDYGDNARYMTTAKNSSNMGFHRWHTLYRLIRQGNLFLENVKVIPPSGVDAEQLTESEVGDMISNVNFMIAYYHFLLFEQYGPIPIIDKAMSPIEELDLPRNSVDEVIEYIDVKLVDAIKTLHQTPYEDVNYRAMPTKGVALAVRAKLWMYAASPLLNGGYKEALLLENNDGKKLFPDADPSKWQKAKSVLKDFIDYANQGNYNLFKIYKDGEIDPDASVYELFQEYNDEVIWATANTGWGGVEWGDRFERRASPRSEPNGLGSTAIVQELVDDFYMKDGLPISKTSFLPSSPLYTEEGFGELNEVSVYNMWIDREPRFYNTVFFAGRRWHISNNATYFHMGSLNDRTGQHTRSGYLLYKRFNRRTHMHTPGVGNVFRPSFIFRLAEFYLLYAEALNEVEPSHPDVLKYINLIRERAGLPNLEDLSPAIAGNKELQREAIRRESRIELATEGQRYFDVRRWMIAEKEEGRQGGDFHGMNMAGEADSFYKRTVFESRIFDPKYYLYPIPFSEMQKSVELVQNPGWN